MYACMCTMHMQWQTGAPWVETGRFQTGNLRPWASISTRSPFWYRATFTATQGTPFSSPPSTKERSIWTNRFLPGETSIARKVPSNFTLLLDFGLGTISKPGMLELRSRTISRILWLMSVPEILNYFANWFATSGLARSQLLRASLRLSKVSLSCGICLAHLHWEEWKLCLLYLLIFDHAKICPIDSLQGTTIKLATTLRGTLCLCFMDAFHFGISNNLIHISSRLVPHVSCKHSKRHVSCLVDNSISSSRWYILFSAPGGAKERL